MQNLYLNILVVSSFALIFALICILFRKQGEESDKKTKRMNYVAQKQSNETVFDNLNQSFYQRIIEPRISKLGLALNKSLPGVFGDEKSNKEIERQLHLAGISKTVTEFNVMKTAIMIVVALITLICVFVFKVSLMGRMLIIVVGLLIAILIPRMYLQSAVKKRQGEIQKSLPDVIDLLSVCMTAGLSFDASVQRVTEKMSGPFIDELKTMHRDLSMGRTRRDALKSLSDSCDIEELRIFTSAVIQADQMGVPIKNILNAQSKQLRLLRKQSAQEKANKAPVKMLIPMVLFIFPVIFIVLLGPAVMSIADNLL